MPNNRTHRRKSSNGSSRHSRYRRTGGARGPSRGPSRGSSQDSRSSRGRAPDIHALNAKKEREAPLRGIAALAQNLNQNTTTPQDASLALRNIIAKIPPGAIKPVLLVVATALLAMIVAPPIADGLKRISDAGAEFGAARRHAELMKPLNDETCKKMGFSDYSLHTKLCQITDPITDEYRRQIGAPDNLYKYSWWPEPIHENENDSPEYIAAINEIKRIEKEELWPAEYELAKAQHTLDEFLKNVQAGDRAEAKGILNERDRQIIAYSKDAVKQYLPIKEGAEAKIKQLHAKIDATKKMADDAEQASRK